MTITRTPRRNRRSARMLALGLLAASTVVIPTRSSEAAGARPNFQLPFACDSKWQPTTYDKGELVDSRGNVTSSWSHKHQLDFAGSTTTGVFPSAPGFARLIDASSGAVEVAHGGGWTTRYLHMADIQVSSRGRDVTTSDRLGNINRVGMATGNHLHYAQLADGAYVASRFDGTEYSWGRGVTESSGSYRFYNARTATATMKSRNCGSAGGGGGGSDPRALIGSIVQWDGDRNNPRASWLVTGPNGQRVWVPTAAVYSCLRASGARDAGAQPAATLDGLPDRSGVHAWCGSSRMDKGQILWGPSRLTSSNGRYKLIVQGDGNLVLYNRSDRAVWATNRSSGSYLAMQGDGNVVLYDKSGRAVWATNTVGRGGRYLVVQNDGNVVLYAGDNNTRPVWATNTVGR